MEYRQHMKAVKDYINLLPQEEKKAAPFATWGVLLTLVFLLAWLGMFGWQAKQQVDLQKRLAALTAQKESLRRQGDVLRKELGIAPGSTALGKAALIQSLLEERVLWSGVFKQFSLIVPKGLWFDSLEGNTAGRAEIKIRGGAFSYSAITEFMVSMEKSGYFDFPQLSYAQKAVTQGQDVVGFEIISGIKKTQGAR
jgi:Tfp pilus assembly protein PilN